MKVLAFAKSRDFKVDLTGNQAVVITDTIYSATVVDDKIKEAYQVNDNAYQFFILSCTDIAFGLVKMAKTKGLKDGDARIAWKNLCDRYAPKGSTDLNHQTGELNNCVPDSPRSDPDLWFIKLDVIRNCLTSIGTKYTKEDFELVAHVINKLPNEYSELITTIESLSTTITLVDLQSKVQAFYTRKLKDRKSGNELALFPKMFKGICRKCGKQGHRAKDCRSTPKEEPKKGVKCYNCNKYAGHIAKDCPEPKKLRLPVQEQQREQPLENGMFVGLCLDDEYVVVEQDEFAGLCFEIVSDSEDDFSEINYGNTPDNTSDKEQASATYKNTLAGNDFYATNFDNVEDSNETGDEDSVDDDYIALYEPHTFASMLLQHDNNYNDEPMGVRNMPVYDWFTHRMNHDFSLHSCNVATVNSINIVERWLVDSGATAHITNSDLPLTSPQSVSVKVMIGNGKEIVCIKRGNVLVKNGGQTLQLKQVLFAPTFTKNIISLGLLCTNSRADNAVVTMTAHKMSLKTKSGGHLKFKTDDGVLFYFQGIRQHPTVSEVFNSETIANLINKIPQRAYQRTPVPYVYNTNSKIPLPSPHTFPLSAEAT